MPKLSKFQRQSRIEFTWPDSDEVLNLLVYPDRFTGSSLEKLQIDLNDVDENNRVSQHHFLCEFLAGMLESWDLTDDNDRVIPISGDSIFESLPITLVSALLDRMKTELAVNPQMPES